ncbi:hypothetical protein DAEQUDRAFT_173396 [Daedalea quercina L-15889]|uniref:Uncharacterized protein n=1 Tax=Daedalea quercina L-15889 TaxID=1314783 RepID=A0A165RC19_9APHY|nr:hypothetical protein DAEQUDRAFT_173396 [Daedalea quercina L-15889]
MPLLLPRAPPAQHQHQHSPTQHQHSPTQHQHSPTPHSPPPTHSLDVPQDVARERSPAPHPEHEHEHEQHAAVPVQGRPRIFAAMGADADEEPDEPLPPPTEQWEHETPLVRGRPRIFAAQEGGGDAGQGMEEMHENDKNEVGEGEGEKEEEAQDGIVRDYPHTHGYPTPRSRSPVLPAERTLLAQQHDDNHDRDDEARGRPRSPPPDRAQDPHRVSRSLPPTPSPRAASPEAAHDTDAEPEPARRRLRKGRRSGSQSDSENEERRRGHPFARGLRGLGIFGMKTLTEKQVEKLGAKDAGQSAQADADADVGVGAAEVGAGAGVQRRESGSDGRRKLRKDSRRGRREERSAEHAPPGQDRDGEGSFVHIDSSAVQEEMQRGRTGPGAPPTPVTPEDYARARTQRRGAKLGKALPAVLAQAVAPAPPPELSKPKPKPGRPYPLVRHLLEPALLAGLLAHLGYTEWLALARLNSQVREAVRGQRPLTECVLERFLGVVGYARWTWGPDPSLAKGKNKERAGDQGGPKLPNDGEPLTLTLQVSSGFGDTRVETSPLTSFRRISTCTCAGSPCRRTSSRRWPLSTSTPAATRTRSP